MAKGDVERRRERAREIDRLLQEEGAEESTREHFRRNNAVARVAGRERVFAQQLHDSLVRIFKTVPLAVPKLQKKPPGKTQRISHLIISDTHYGSWLDPREVGHSYGPLEESRRTAAICRAVATYKLRHRSETELYVHLMGDLIQGQLHDKRDGAPLAEQVADAIRILVQALRYLVLQFPRGVTVWCTPGNHGRNKDRHKERAVLQKWDAIETMIYVALKEVAQFIPGLKVMLGYEPKYDFPLFDNLGLGTHGDTVINVGYPGKSINVEGMSKQINAINNGRAIKGKTLYRVVQVGHVHTGTLTHLPGGIVVITNGCLIPPDSYSNSHGVFEGVCGQWMYESTPDHPVGDARLVLVDEVTDQDATLDDIIKPYQGLGLC